MSTLLRTPFRLSVMDHCTQTLFAYLQIKNTNILQLVAKIQVTMATCNCTAQEIPWELIQVNESEC